MLQSMRCCRTALIVRRVAGVPAAAVPRAMNQLHQPASHISTQGLSHHSKHLCSSLRVSHSNNNSITHRLFRTCACDFDEVRTIQVPAFAESLTEGDIRWDKAVGDSVREDDLVGEIETDKTAIPINSPAAGVIQELLVEDGSTVKPGMDIFKLLVGPAGAAAPAPPTAAAKPATESAPPPAAAAKPAVEKAAAPAPAKTEAPAPTAGGGAPDAGAGAAAYGEQRVKMNRMRLRIAQRLKDAQNTYAMLTTFNEIDMTNAIDMRNTYKDAFVKKHGLKLGFMSPFVRATAYALQDQPIVNAVIDENEIIYRDYVDISVAVATPKGLVVPVLRNVNHMNLAQIERAIAAMGEKARSGSLAIEDMDGGTFTISNGGVFGSMFGTPIINPPQSAILGMHAIIERPIAVAGQVVIRPMMYVALTYDHRLIDGREAVTFLKKIKAAVEDPRVMFLDL